MKKEYLIQQIAEQKERISELNSLLRDKEKYIVDLLNIIADKDTQSISEWKHCTQCRERMFSIDAK
jgi:hypothetical protein